MAGAGEFASVLRSIEENLEFVQEYGEPIDEEILYRDLNEYADSTLPKDHPLRPQYLSNLGRAMLRKQRFASAERLLLDALDLWRQRQGSDGLDVKLVLNALVELYDKTERPDKKREYQRRLVAARRK